MFPLFKHAYKATLTEDDLYSPLKEHKSSNIGSKLEQLWRKEYKTKKHTALHWALIKLFGWRFLIFGVMKLFTETLYL